MVADLKFKAAGRSKPARRVVVAEDAAREADLIRYYLESQGFDVRVVATLEAALNLVQRQPLGLVLLDSNLLDSNGPELCYRFHSQAASARIPILVLTARSDKPDTLMRLAADGYLRKPIGRRNLLARVNAIFHQTIEVEPEAPVYDDGVLLVDPWWFCVRYAGREIRLTRKEMKLLAELARHEGRVMPREDLLDRVWGGQEVSASRTLDVHIRKLRLKLGNPKLIETVIGVGYRLVGRQTNHP